MIPNMVGHLDPLRLALIARPFGSGCDPSPSLHRCSPAERPYVAFRQNTDMPSKLWLTMPTRTLGEDSRSKTRMSDKIHSPILAGNVFPYHGVMEGRNKMRH